MGRGRPRDLVGSDLDGHEHAELGPCRSRRRCRRSTSDPADAGKNYRVDARRGLLDRAAARRRAPWADLRARPRRGLPRARRPRAALPRRLRVRPARTTPSWSATCASPATGSPASTPSPRRASCSTRWAGARSASASRRRSAPRWPAPGPTVAVCGDGGFLFACGELATVAQEQIPLTTVIVDDGGYGMLRFDQDQAGDAALRRRPAARRTSRRWRSPSACAPRPSRASTTRSARRWPRTSPTRRRRVLVARAEALTPPPTTSPQWYRRRPAPA